jgi:predicted anti-sigma-YlaC factor YlaD
MTRGETTPSNELTCRELVEVVTEYLEGTMEPEDRLRFEEHLAFCTWCVDYLDQVRETIRVTGALKEEHLTPKTRDDLLKVFRNWKSV